MNFKITKIRPWQGTFLATISIFGIVGISLSIIMILSMFVGGGIFTSYFTNMQGVNTNISLFPIFATVGVFMLIPLIPFLIFQIYMTKGLFNGKRWTILISLALTIFSILGILSAIPQISSKEIPSFLLSIGIIGFLFYLEIICIKHPFYEN